MLQAFDLWKGGWSESHALDDVVAGKAISADDRTLIATELAALITTSDKSKREGGAGQDAGADALEAAMDAASEPGPLALPDDDEDDDAEQDDDDGEQDVGGGDHEGGDREHAAPTRRTLHERLVEAQVAAVKAEIEVQKLQLLIIAKILSHGEPSRPAARMVKASVHAGFLSEALPYAVKGCHAIELVTPDPPTLAGLFHLLAEYNGGLDDV